MYKISIDVCLDDVVEHATTQAFFNIQNIEHDVYIHLEAVIRLGDTGGRIPSCGTQFHRGTLHVVHLPAHATGHWNIRPFNCRNWAKHWCSSVV